MFDFELLPHEMQLEIVKQVEFRTLQRMKIASQHVKKLIQRYKRYTKPMPIRQLLVTPGKLSFTLEGSCDVVSMEPGQAADFLKGAVVDLLWFEMPSSSEEEEPCEILSRTLPSSLKINTLKLGSSRRQCDVTRLFELLAQWFCTNLIVEWRFHVPRDFYAQARLQQLDGLSIGEESARDWFEPMESSQLLQFTGSWLEVGANSCSPQDLIKLIERWKSGKIHEITLYNIALSFPMVELASLLKSVAKLNTMTSWTATRGSQGLRITYYHRTNFANFPSIVLQQFQVNRWFENFE
ncbi:unnamed protein product [Caenorhabditis auriculariae]|uniref:F-box domain-containing protein n=1 Tax=Caenorhabditis auriculariae TaxID=2777116 RepID=A0A8S1HNN0_9PELO|nr:unnamed protein product [Caenorhabditis auriculariae]